jgi:outer membrane lipoprotein-sorting protein
MIRSFAAVLLLALPAATVPAPAVAQATGDLARVQQHLRALQTMTATFIQTDRTGRSLSGTLTLKKPGRIRFQYEKGVPILIVSDGSAFTFIDYSVGQKQRWPVKNSPLGVLIDPDRDISRFAHVVAGGDPRVITVEASDSRHPEYGRITLVFARDAAAPAGLMLQGWVQLDGQGNRTSIRLSGQRFNLPVSDNSFRYNEPRRR